MSEPNGLDLVREFGASRAEFWASPPRGRCAREGCLDEDQILYSADDGEQVCAGHYRLQSNRDKGYPCDICGQTPSFRDPAHRENVYLCPEHHEKNGYVPTERAMVTKTARRVGVTHSQGRKAVCIAAGKGTDCKGQIKQRGKLGQLCDFHYNPKKFLERKAP